MIYVCKRYSFTVNMLVDDWKEKVPPRIPHSWVGRHHSCQLCQKPFQYHFHVPLPWGPWPVLRVWHRHHCSDRTHQTTKVMASRLNHPLVLQYFAYPLHCNNNRGSNETNSDPNNMTNDNIYIDGNQLWHAGTWHIKSTWKPMTTWSKKTSIRDLKMVKFPSKYCNFNQHVSTPRFTNLYFLNQATKMMTHESYVLCRAPFS